MWKFGFTLISLFLLVVPAQAMKCGSLEPEEVFANADMIFIGYSEGTETFPTGHPRIKLGKTTFRIIKTYKGDPGETVTLDHLAYGPMFPVRFEKGASLVSANYRPADGKLTSSACHKFNTGKPAFRDWLKDHYPAGEMRWHAVWVDGFDPENFIYGDQKFDWTRAQLTTRADDPGDWRSFSAKCNGVYRKYVSRTVKKPFEDEFERVQAWSAVITQVACTERAADGREVASRAMAIENRIMELVIGVTDNRLSYEIDADGQLVWLDEYGHPLAKFERLKTD